jgi:hypothetical protein
MLQPSAMQVWLAWAFTTLSLPTENLAHVAIHLLFIFLLSHYYDRIP